MRDKGGKIDLQTHPAMPNQWLPNAPCADCNRHPSRSFGRADRRDDREWHRRSIPRSTCLWVETSPSRTCAPGRWNGRREVLALRASNWKAALFTQVVKSPAIRPPPRGRSSSPSGQPAPQLKTGDRRPCQSRLSSFRPVCAYQVISTHIATGLQRYLQRSSNLKCRENDANRQKIRTWKDQKAKLLSREFIHFNGLAPVAGVQS